MANSFVQGMNIGSSMVNAAQAHRLAVLREERAREAHDAEMLLRNQQIDIGKEDAAYRSAMQALPTTRVTGGEMIPSDEATGARIAEARTQDPNYQFRVDPGTGAVFGGGTAAPMDDYGMAQARRATALKFNRPEVADRYESIMAAERKKYLDKHNREMGVIRAEAAQMEWSPENASKSFGKIRKLYDNLPDDMQLSFVRVGDAFVPVQQDQNGVGNPIIGPNGQPIAIRTKEDWLRAIDMYHAAASGPEAVARVEEAYLKRAREATAEERAAAGERRAQGKYDREGETHTQTLRQLTTEADVSAETARSRIDAAKSAARVALGTEASAITRANLENDALRARIAASYADANRSNAAARAASESGKYFAAVPMVGPDGVPALVQVSKDGKSPAIISPMPAGYRQPRDTLSDRDLVTVAGRISAETNTPIGVVMAQIRTAMGGVDPDARIVDRLKQLQQPKPAAPFDAGAALRQNMASQSGAPVVDMSRARAIAAQSRPPPVGVQTADPRNSALGGALQYLPR